MMKTTVRYRFEIGESVKLGDDLIVWFEHDGRWFIQSSDLRYIGQGQTRDGAILDFLRVRLGLP